MDDRFDEDDLPDEEIFIALNEIEGLPDGFNLLTIIEAMRPFLRPMPLIEEPLFTEAWNIVRIADDQLLVCRHLHPDGEECDREIWVRREELSDEDKDEALEILRTARTHSEVSMLDALLKRFELRKR